MRLGSARTYAEQTRPGKNPMLLAACIAPAILDTLIDSGYDGWYELEVMSDDGSVATEYPDRQMDFMPALSAIWASRGE